MRKLIDTVLDDRFKAIIYGTGTVVVLLCVLFKIFHWSGASILIVMSMVVATIILLLEILSKTYNK